MGEQNKKRKILPIDLMPETEQDIKIIVDERRKQQPGYKRTDAIREALRVLAQKIKGDRGVSHE